MKNYTTKPIELPLSTEKEYVLVDVKKWLSSESNEKYNSDALRKLNLDSPFKFDRVGFGGDGCISTFNYIIRMGDNVDMECFHEVIRQPEVKQLEDGYPRFYNDPAPLYHNDTPVIFPSYGIESEIEWKNGDECTYDGSRYIFVGMTPNFNDVSCIIFDPKNGIEHVSVGKLRKPETESERKERERLEAIEEIYRDMQLSGCVNFTKGMADYLYLNGYRKEQN